MLDPVDEAVVDLTEDDPLQNATEKDITEHVPINIAEYGAEILNTDDEQSTKSVDERFAALRNKEDVQSTKLVDESVIIIEEEVEPIVYTVDEGEIGETYTGGERGTREGIEPTVYTADEAIRDEAGPTATSELPVKRRKIQIILQSK